MSLRVAICITTRNRRAELERTLAQIAALVPQPDEILVVADGCVAWSGGRNFTDEAFFVSHDLSYTLAGPLAAQMAQVFDEFWQSYPGRLPQRFGRKV